jgi:iron complex transport system permease protein
LQTITAAVIVCLLMGMLTLRWGSVALSTTEVWHALFGTEETATTNIVWTLRLPRLILGLLVGLSLALCGVLLQAVMQNPLADPGIIGVSAGGGLVAVILVILFPQASGWLPAAAALGGLGAALGIYALAWRGGGISPLRLILAGVAVNAFLSALMGILMLLYSERVPAVLGWMAGSLNGRSWPHVQLLWPYACAAGLLACLSARFLNLLLLGEERAAALGIRLTRVRVALSAVAAVLAAGVVSIGGLIGFVGLIVPHFCRLLVGADHRFLLPTAVLVGAALVVSADLCARACFAPLELPVGTMLALLGAPYFLWLLRKDG